MKNKVKCGNSSAQLKTKRFSCHKFDKLINQAMRITGKNTPQEVVIFALQKLLLKKDALSQAFGKYPWENDLDAMRSDVKHVSDVLDLSGF